MFEKWFSKKGLTFALAAIITVASAGIFHPAQASADPIVSGQVYKLINVNSGKALDVEGSGTSNYTNVIIYTDNGTGAQRWRIIANSDGTYKLINTNSNKALDVYSSGTDDYTNVDIYDDNGTGAQKWNIIANGDGSYKLINPNSNMALDVYAAGTADYTNVDIYTDNGTGAQKWNIIRVDDNSGNPGNPGGQVYSYQDFTAYTSPVGGLTASGISPVPYTSAAVHPSDRYNPYSAPVFPFGSIITTTQPLYLPGYGAKSTFVVHDKGDLAFQKSEYWVDILFDFENNPNAVPNAINFGNQKVSYTVSR
ncbi:RICIN domain-containing protein [Paenibacillus macerans]|uniref:RICIN domain-containing protein n=1 Tax=Paenibacillus macerans TaxID=44252 RepID=UPI00203A5E61|nr:RICIN domain-containing protein [Paenibacillus macerans]MCM3703148.1 RICIN domain-containing protein [Paenibacillus macerans]